MTPLPIGVEEEEWKRLNSRFDHTACWKTLTGLTIIAVIVIRAGAAFAFDADAALASFKKCRTCHEIGEGARNKVGPQLNGLNGRKAASLNDFKYSNPFLKAGAEGLAWNADRLDAFIKKPRDLVKGTRMSFAGLKDDDERGNLIGWLLHFSADGSEMAEMATGAKWLGASATAIKGDLDYGRYLSGECVTCHRLSGGDNAIPPITGWAKAPFIHALYEYKTKIRGNPVMQTVTGRLGDEEMAALAAYFGSLPVQ